MHSSLNVNFLLYKSKKKKKKKKEKDVEIKKTHTHTQTHNLLCHFSFQGSFDQTLLPDCISSISIGDVIFLDNNQQIGTLFVLIYKSEFNLTFCESGDLWRRNLDFGAIKVKLSVSFIHQSDKYRFFSTREFLKNSKILLIGNFVSKFVGQHFFF